MTEEQEKNMTFDDWISTRTKHTDIVMARRFFGWSRKFFPEEVESVFVYAWGCHYSSAIVRTKTGLYYSIESYRKFVGRTLREVEFFVWKHRLVSIMSVEANMEINKRLKEEDSLYCGKMAEGFVYCVSPGSASEEI
jgi:hypothetical protein